MMRNMSTRVLLLSIGSLCLLFTALSAASVRQQPSSAAATPAVSPPPSARAFLDRYCVVCHNERNRANVRDFVLANVDVSNIAAHPDIWEKVIKKVRGGLMPPASAPRPERRVIDQFVDHLEAEIDRASMQKPDPGRKASLHRLNRTEYGRVIRDLLALDVDVTELLPADEGANDDSPFDNNATSLKLSEALLERYLSAAYTVSRAALGRTPPAVSAEFKAHEDIRQDQRLEGLPLGSRGGMLVHYRFPVDAEYAFKITMVGNGKTDMLVSLDGSVVERFSVAPMNCRPPEDAQSTDSCEANLRLGIKAGPRVVAVTFPKTAARTELEADRLPSRLGRGPLPAVHSVMIGGPFAVSGPGQTASRERIFACRPAIAVQEIACAERILGTLARRAYRRPVTRRDIGQLLAFYRAGRADGDFEAGIEAGLTALLVSPSFLLRVELDPSQTAPDTVYRLSDLELASRLSFFLWSSIPDDELLDLAVAGRLKDPIVFKRQVRRMLADPRAESFTTNFAAQWLHLENMEIVEPAAAQFPTFDRSLRTAFRKETELFFDSIRREDRSLLDLLDADYTFLNERLAEFYGIPRVSGAEFQRVPLPRDSPRRGLLGKGSVLVMTSRPTRTSPVLRGKWVLDNLLGTPPPPPPPNVPALPAEKQDDGRVLTVREVLTQHRANPVCASCHSMMDPLGFALEQFDAIGRWRTVDNTTVNATYAPIDASGMFPDGTKFSGVVELRSMLLNRSDRFVTTLTEKLLTYALGRALTYADAPTVRRIVRESAKDHFKFSSIVMGIVQSVPFQMRTTDASQPQRVTVASGSRNRGRMNALTRRVPQ